MKNMTLLAIDDEYPALQTLVEYSQRATEVELIGSFQKAQEALDFALNHHPDVLLLDIQMPRLSGTELLRKLPKGQVCIFFTANPEFALEAYELDVVDYVIKPFTFNRFQKALDKARAYLEFQRQENGHGDHIMVKADYMMHKIPVADVHWVEGMSEYIKIVTARKTYVVLMRLTEFEEKYKDFGFVRIHKSYIAPLGNVQSYNSQVVKLYQGKELPVGRVYKQNLGI